MKIVIDESINVVSQLIIPIIILMTTARLAVFELKYLRLQEKRHYVELLRMRFPYLEAFVSTREKYHRVDLLSIYVFMFSLFIGSWIENSYVDTFFPIFDFIRRYFSDSLTIFSLGIIYFLLMSIPIVIIIALWFGWHKMTKLSHLLDPKRTKFCGFGKPQIIIYTSYKFFAGVIIGSSSVIYSFLERNRLLTYDYLLMYLPVILLSFYCLVDLYRNDVSFFKKVIDPITNKHKCSFPYLKIKTESGEAIGQLDTYNKSIITLNEKDKFNFIPWDKIEIMEASRTDESNYITLENHSLK